MDEPAVYEVIVQGHISARRAEWFEGFSITPLPDGTTRLVGAVPDQPALHALLARIRDLNMPLILVRRG